MKLRFTQVTWLVATVLASQPLNAQTITIGNKYGLTGLEVDVEDPRPGGMNSNRSNSWTCLRRTRRR
ncbi:MAG: hypothetical protein FD180_866 [Planctomycetota bacterium]|nr:MAG: hypothetical protein FD180_866 [Planctomycetota bacterium]